MKTRLFALLAVFAVGAAFAAAQQNVKYQPHQNKMVEDQMPAGYNKTARINVEGDWDLFLTGSFIYWQPMGKGLDLAYNAQTYPLKGKTDNMDFDWQPEVIS